MSIESLKEQARRHEQKEEWRKALDLYGKAIAKLAEEDSPDIGLYNRVGDLDIRLGNIEEAVNHYEQAVDLYVEAELPNNAIAVCKKVIRNLPNRHSIYLKMGQIRAEQGFISDARTSFLTYAERMQQAGELDESFRALVEFADLAPEDVGVRLAVADQMASNERIDEAVEQLSIVYRTLMLKGEETEAEAVEARIRELNPDADLSSVALVGGQELAITGSGLPDDDIFGSFGAVELGSGHEVRDREGEVEDEEAGSATDGFDIAHGDEEVRAEDAEEEEEEALPTFGFDGVEEAEAVPAYGVFEEPEDAGAEPLPTFGLDDEEEPEPLPILDAAEPEEPEDASATEEAGVVEVEAELSLEHRDSGSDAAREAAFEEGAAETAPELTLDAIRSEIEACPDDVSVRQRFVELAYQEGDEKVITEAYLGLADALQRGGQAARAKAAYQQVLQVDPSNETALAALDRATPTTADPVQEVASSEDYVDLGSMILGDEREKTTRFVVAYEEPSGDEQADFAKMLSQFKEKVSENLDASDVRAHHDLGTAYMEMGLLDEAVAEFQQALRGSANHLPTYELLGQTFLALGKPDAAVRSLERALESPFEVEDELVGIYYYLARAYEDLGKKDAALEYYDQVFSLDINFADVTERLRALR